jgi:hypothetical protein
LRLGFEPDSSRKQTKIFNAWGRMVYTGTLKEIWLPNLYLISSGLFSWDDNVKQDICKMKLKNWTVCVQDRGKWRDVAEKAKTFNI